MLRGVKKLRGVEGSWSVIARLASPSLRGVASPSLRGVAEAISTSEATWQSHGIASATPRNDCAVSDLHYSPITHNLSPLTPHPNGFSLLEIVIALAIVTIGVVGVMIIFPAGLRAQQRAADFTTAATLGSRTLQEITARGHYNVLKYLPTPPPFTSPREFFPNHPGWQWQASFIYDLEPLVRVTVSIYWDGENREKNFITFMAP